MPSTAFIRSKTRLNSNKLTRTLRKNFSAQPDVRSAAVMGNKLIAVGGSLYDSTVGSDSIGEAVAVVNVGRPAAAIYAPSSGGSAVVSVSAGGGGASSGGSFGGSFSDITGTIGDAQAPQFLKTDGSRALYGSMAVSDGVTIDGVDISVHAGNPNAHHNWQHGMLSTADHVYSGGNALDIFGLSAASTLGVLTPSANPGAASAILKSNGAGNLTLESLTTPLLNTASGNLTIDPVGDVLFPDTQIVRTVGFNSSFPIQGFSFYPVLDQDTGLPTGKSGLTVGVVVADEIHTKIFVADETRIDRGELWISKSFGVTSAKFTTPSAINGTVTIDFDDSPALNGAIFSSGDYLLFRILDESSGLDIAQAWGTVSSYHDYDADTPIVKPNRQSWVFTLKNGATSYNFPKGAFAVDFGQSGQGVIQETVLDPAGAPYIRIASWATNPYSPSNYTTHVRLGKMFSSDDNVMSPSGWGLFSDNAYLRGRLLAGGGNVLLDDNGVATTTIQGFGTSNRYGFRWNAVDGPEQGFLGARSWDGTDYQVLLSAKGISGGSWGSVALRARTSAQAGMDGTLDSVGGNLLVTPENVFVGPNKGVIISDDGADIANTAGAGYLYVGNIRKTVSGTADIGTSSNRFDTIYANNIVAGTLTATTSIGSTLSGAIWQNDASNMTIESDSSSNRVLYVTNTSSGHMDLNVDNDIILGGLVDGVDLSAFKTAYDSHTHAHSSLTGLTGDDHTNYVHISTNRTITAQHAFSPGTARAPFTLGANAQGQTVTGFKADQLNKQVIAGSGLSGTGTLTADVSLSLLWGTPTIGTITPDASANAGTSTNPARSDHIHAIVAAAPAANLTVSTTNVEGTATSFLRSDATFGITSSSNPGAAASLLASTSGGGLTLQSLNIGTVGSISTAGVVSMADDTDTLHKLGRGFVGYASYADYAAFGHRDWASAGNYALMQGGADANTYLNTTNGNSIYHRHNNVDVLQMTAQRLNPAGSSQIDLGDYNRKYRTLFASELYVEVLVAQSVMATIGGRIMVAPTTKLIADVNAYQQYIDVKDNSIFNNDFIRLETAPGGVPQVEAMQVVSDPTAITGGYRYNVIRKVDSAAVATLIAAITSTSATTMDVSTNILASGNYAYIGSTLGMETVQINSAPTTITGGYRYTIIRNVTATGAKTVALGTSIYYTYRSWASGDALVSLAGGAGAVAALIANMTTGATTLDVNSSGLALNALYYFQTSTQAEFVQVTSAPSTITGGYRYSVTRNMTGGGAKAWVVGNTLHPQAQMTGRGYIDLTSTSTIHNHMGPTMAIYTRNSAASWNSVVPGAAFGNLRSFVDYTGDLMGWAVGNNLTLTPTGGFSGMTGDAVNGLRQFNTYTKMYQSGVEIMRIDPAVGIDIAVGANHYNHISWKTNIADVTPIAAISTYNPGTYKYMDIQVDDGSNHGLVRVAADATNGAFVVLEGRSASSTFGMTVTPTLATIGNIYFENNYSGGDSATASVITNDTGTYKALMLVGNTSNGGSTRNVRVFDDLRVAGKIVSSTLGTSTVIQWALGDYTATPQTSTGYITVVINGTAYKLLAHT